MTEKDKDKKKKLEQEEEKEEVVTEEEKTDSPEYQKEMLPPLDFTSLFLPFYTQALFKLGAAEDPISQKIDENINLAKRFIDLLDLLKEKTKGNLKPEEDTLLINGLHQLKMLYMEKSKIIKL
ncbi:MAG: DUF1844 domain-containing protein [Candidatus Aminicenantes bacterium]|nr:DUF1844 domain-containing protein [Candidatus Aminicenantes bacterium]